MMDAQAVIPDVKVRLGKVILELNTTGVAALEIPVDPQAAFELGEKLARAAHEARFGEPWQSDQSYLADQIKRRTTEDYRNMLVRKLTHMFRSFYKDPKKWPPLKAAEETVDIVLSRALPSVSSGTGNIIVPKH